MTYTTFDKHSYIVLCIRWSTQVSYCSCLFLNWQFQAYHCLHFIAYEKVPLNVFICHGNFVSLIIIWDKILLVRKFNHSTIITSLTDFQMPYFIFIPQFYVYAIFFLSNFPTLSTRCASRERGIHPLLSQRKMTFNLKMP